MRRRFFLSYLLLTCVIFGGLFIGATRFGLNADTLLLGGGALSIVLCWLIAKWMSNRMAGSIDKIADTVKKIGGGDYGAKAAVEDSGFDELIVALNAMSRGMKYNFNMLSDSYNRIEAVLNGLTNAIITLDSDYRIILINDACKSLLEINGDVYHKEFFSMIRDNCFFDIIEELGIKELGQRDGVTKEFTHKRGNEPDKIFRVFAGNILFAGDKGSGIIFVIEDVTQVRKLEQMRTDFVSNVTHEIKTPLTSIIGFVDTLRQGAVTDEKTALHFLDIIDNEAERLNRLISDILSLSEIQTRTKDVNMSPNSIPSIIERVCEVLSPEAAAKGIEINIVFGENIPVYVCNEDRISQMLINLIGNAIKYTDAGSITVSCRRRDEFMELVVEDTGIGIEKQYIERIFERFYRVDKGRSRKMGGTGLGLSIVKHVVNLYSGTIIVQSKINKGSKFVIRLPL